MAAAYDVSAVGNTYRTLTSKGRTDRFYVFIPLPLAAAIGLEAGEEFQWSLTDRNTLAVHRLLPTPAVARGAKSAKAAKSKKK